MSDPILLRLNDVLKIFPVSKSTWWGGIKSGIYPKPIRLSERRVVWHIDDIQKLIKDLMKDRKYR